MTELPDWGKGAMWEPTFHAIKASMKNPANVRLAHAIFPKLTHGRYDPHSAHRWALKLIKHDPADGLAVTTCLVNYDWMIDNAAHEYETVPAKRTRYDALHAIYAAWKAANPTEVK